MSQALANALDQPIDRLRLVARRGEAGFELEARRLGADIFCGTDGRVIHNPLI